MVRLEDSQRRLGIQHILLVSFVVISWASAAAAEDELDSDRSGPYASVGISGGLPIFDGAVLFRNTLPNPASTDEEDSVGFNLRAGWRFHRVLAAELQYEWLGDWKVSTGNRTCARVGAQVLTGNLRLFLPFEAVQPYALAGVGGGRYRQRTRSVDLGIGVGCRPLANKPRTQRDWELTGRFGGGFDIYVTRNLVLNLEGSTVYSSERPLDVSWPYVSVQGNLMWRF